MQYYLDRDGSLYRRPGDGMPFEIWRGGSSWEKYTSSNVFADAAPINEADAAKIIAGK